MGTPVVTWVVTVLASVIQTTTALSVAVDAGQDVLPATLATVTALPGVATTTDFAVQAVVIATSAEVHSVPAGQIAFPVHGRTAVLMVFPYSDVVLTYPYDVAVVMSSETDAQVQTLFPSSVLIVENGRSSADVIRVTTGVI
jgi:hypothetical protein